MAVFLNSSALTAVLFDWDFTLAYSVGPNVSLNKRTAVLFQKYGVSCTETDIAAAREAIAAERARTPAKTPHPPQRKREIIQLYRELLRRLEHPDTSYAFAYEIYAGYGRLPHSLFPDVLPTLKQLEKKNLLLSILSNHSSSVRSTISKLLGSIIPQERIVISEELGVHKPSKTIFKRAAAKLNQKPEQCLYVGDNLQVDAIAAVTNGGFAGGVWLDRSGQAPPEVLPANVYHITALAQLILLLQ